MTSKITAQRQQMPTKVAYAVAAVVAFSLLPINTALADEAFVCGDGSVVNVKSGDLEIVKRTNPCVARYFGLDVSTNSIETAKAMTLGATALLRGDGNTALPLPSRNPNRPDSAQTAVTAVTAATAGAVASAARTPITQPTSQIETGSTRRGAASLDDPATDYRNVRILNAQPGAAAWFRHNR